MKQHPWEEAEWPAAHSANHQENGARHQRSQRHRHADGRAGVRRVLLLVLRVGVQVHAESQKLDRGDAHGRQAARQLCALAQTLLHGIGDRSSLRRSHQLEAKLSQVRQETSSLLTPQNPSSFPCLLLTFYLTWVRYLYFSQSQGRLLSLVISSRSAWLFLSVRLVIDVLSLLLLSLREPPWKREKEKQ